ncbi:MAG: SGNH/GDSL hydrolase family protein [Patescibacteria group bacterium]
MNKLTVKTKTALIVGATIVMVGGVYLNRAYSHIYSTIGAAGLPPVETPGRHTIINNSEAGEPLVYAILGDSLSAGAGAERPADSLPHQLAVRLAGPARNAILYNESVSSYKTADLLPILLPVTIAAQPDVVTVLIGVNDIHNQVSLPDFRRNYEQILEQLTAGTTARIYAVSIPFIGADRLMRPPYQAYFDYQTRRFNAVIQELAVKYGVSYVDLYSPTVSLFKKSGGHYSADLFHPSATGYQIWADLIYDRIHQ